MAGKIFLRHRKLPCHAVSLRALYYSYTKMSAWLFESGAELNDKRKRKYSKYVLRKAESKERLAAAIIQEWWRQKLKNKVGKEIYMKT